MTSPAQPAHRRLRDKPGFGIYYTARTVAWTGNVMSLVALPIMVFQLSGSATLTGLVTALEAVPYLLLGLLVGALADRWDNRRVMALWAAVPGVAMVTVPLAQLAGRLTTGQLLAVALVVGIAFVFADAASFGALPVLVGRDLLAQANSTLGATYSVLSITGPAVAGVIIATVGTPWVLGIDGIGCMIAALLLTRLPWTHERVAANARRALRADMSEGLAFIWRHPVIRPLTFMGIGNSITSGIVGGLLVVVASQSLGLSQQDGRLGLLFTAAAAGSVAGSLLLPRLQRTVTIGVLTIASYAAIAIAAIVLAGLTWWVAAAVVLAVMNLTSTVITLNGIVARQTLTPIRLQSRVNTTARMIAWGGAPAGAVIGGLVATAWGVNVALLVGAAGTTTALAVGVVAGVGSLTYLRSMEPAADEV